MPGPGGKNCDGGPSKYLNPFRTGLSGLTGQVVDRAGDNRHLVTVIRQEICQFDMTSPACLVEGSKGLVNQQYMHEAILP